MAALQALGIALKLTLQGANQFVHVETYFCILVRPPCAALGPASDLWCLLLAARRSQASTGPWHLHFVHERVRRVRLVCCIITCRPRMCCWMGSGRARSGWRKSIVLEHYHG